ncbi:MAG: hypothetical protein ACE5NA_05120, partial [Nitrospiraceae bacterium]
VDVAYQYAPMFGPQNRIAAVELEGQEQILGEHFEFQTINQQIQFNMNYGVTDNITVQLTIPVVFRDHDHNIEVGVNDAEPEGEFENFDASGLGDIRLMGKYGFLPTLRSLVVVGLGVDFPTGNFQARNREGKIQEPWLQVGRGNYGFIGHLFQSYELLPHRLNQFLSFTYEHTFENKFNYQFGDRYILSGGVNWLVTPKITLSAQLNYRYAVQDKFDSNLEAAGPTSAPTGKTTLDPVVRTRGVANTGSTALFFTPGINLALAQNTNWYFYGQAPLARDFNGALAQGVSFLTGVVHFFDFSGETS